MTDETTPVDDEAEQAFDDYYARGGQGLADDVWRRIKERLGIVAKVATLALLTTAAGSALAIPKAHASEVPGLPDCGGNRSTRNPTVPWDCGNAKQIAGIVGGPVVGRLHLSNGSGTASVTVTVTLPQPQAFDVTVAGFWHLGISSGPETASSAGVIPAGALEATVTTNRTGICDGQFDFQVNKPAGVGKSDLYRLHGPFLTVPNCIGTQLVPSPPASSTPVPPTAPPATTPGAPSPGPGASTPTLPATGFPAWFWVALAGSFILAGVSLVKAGVRRP